MHGITPSSRTSKGWERRVRHWKRTNGRCWYCGSDLLNPSSMILDHVIPRRAGGPDSDDNLVPCCGPCNTRKHHRTMESFREYERLRHVQFTPAQEKYLQTLGIELPPLDQRPGYVFAFEEQGWQ